MLITPIVTSPARVRRFPPLSALIVGLRSSRPQIIRQREQRDGDTFHASQGSGGIHPLPPSILNHQGSAGTVCRAATFSEFAAASRSRSVSRYPLASRMRHATLPSAGRLFPAPGGYYYVDSEWGTLKEVLLASPEHLSLVPCNAVSIEAVRRGLASCSTRSAEQHRAMAAALTKAGVDVHLAPAMPGMPDLAFTRDTSLMTPWGLVGLRPGALHRRSEVDVVLRAAARSGVPTAGRVESGQVEGGDICLLRPGVVVIGVSGVRTDAAGAEALGAMFKIRGWTVITTEIDARLLHLDTHFCMLDQNLALGCTERLDPAFLAEVAGLGVKVIPVHLDEVSALGCNVLALGQRRIISPGTAPRIDEAVRRLGFEVITVALDEFTRCGGGVHCLTMPLRREAGSFGRT
ncbi:dimethylarginine dimethylaminohydrolase family protein [Allosphingosinicella deserti]|uniref:arginine deiminase n=1 Tax=Allosphingosinicella deserti TaxID=2116704 RepID=A0A2P7QW16_9SPHN|nr:arginine deiminase family protein [Sphingomonas deserti]PSJ42162.1 hypothetical protein C7I55_07970 [Sphingomonas deserti]